MTINMKNILDNKVQDFYVFKRHCNLMISAISAITPCPVIVIAKTREIVLFVMSLIFERFGFRFFWFDMYFPIWIK